MRDSCKKNILKKVKNLKEKVLEEGFVKCLAIDFDGTITHQSGFPAVGEINPEAIAACNRLQKAGYKLALWTCRTGSALEDAVNACKENGLIFDYINDSALATPGRKIVVMAYIDDSSWPLCTLPKRDRINWKEILDYYKA